MPPRRVSHPAGHAILRTALTQARAHLDGRLEAAFAIGSLAHGGFAPATSDADLALIIDRTDTTVATAIDAVRQNTIAQYTGSPFHSLADRLSIFWTDWQHLADGTEAGRFPATDRLDLLDSGIPLYGTDRRATCTRPSRDDLLRDSATFAVTKFGAPTYLHTLRNPTELTAQGTRAVTKATLFPVRLLYTAATGRLGRNDDAAAWYTTPPQPSSSLVTAAARWRTNGIDDTAPDLLHRELLPLYLHCLAGLTAHTTATDHQDLATQLTHLHATLARTPQ